MDLTDVFHRIVLEIRNSFSPEENELEDCNAREAYFSEGVDGFSRETLEEILEDSKLEFEVAENLVVIHAFLRLIYPLFSIEYRTVKSRLANLLYLYFWTGNKSALSQLMECGRIVIAAAHVDATFRDAIRDELQALVSNEEALPKRRGDASALLAKVMEWDELQDNSLLAQIQRLSKSCGADDKSTISKVHAILWQNFNLGISKESSTSRLTIYIHPKTRRHCAVDFLKMILRGSARSIDPIDIGILADASEDNPIPLFIYGRVNGTGEGQFLPVNAYRYEAEGDRLFYRASNHRVGHSIPNVSGKAVFKHEGAFRLLRKGDVFVEACKREGGAYGRSILETPVVVAGLNEREAFKVMQDTGYKNLTAVYVTSMGVVKSLQNQNVANRGAVLFVPKAAVLEDIVESRKGGQWAEVRELLGYSWDTEFDCLLIEEKDKHVYFIDERARRIVCLDAISSMCDWTRFGEIRETIENDDSMSFAWTPEFCAAVDCHPDGNRQVIDIPYASESSGVVQRLNNLLLKVRRDSGTALSYKIRREMFDAHGPVRAGTDDAIDSIRGFISELEIQGGNIDEIASEFASLNFELKGKSLSGTDCLATEKYCVVKQAAEALEPGSSIQLYQTSPNSEAENIFLSRMMNLNGLRNVFTPTTTLTPNDVVWYTAIRPGRREVMDFVYPRASRDVWFVYPWERQFLDHIKHICFRFISKLFDMRELCGLLNVKFVKSEGKLADDSGAEDLGSRIHDRLEMLDRYFAKLKRCGFDDRSSGGDEGVQVLASWRISLDNGAKIWATDEYVCIVENEDGGRQFVRPKNLRPSTIIWELRPPREIMKNSPEFLNRLVERERCPLFFRWKDLLREYRIRNGLSKRDLYERLQARGISVSYEAVLNWLSDSETKCPNNGVKTLTAIADLVGEPSLSDQAAGIELVAKTMRVFNQTEARDMYDKLRQDFVRGKETCEIGDTTVDLTQYGLFVSGRVSGVEPLDEEQGRRPIVNRIVDGRMP